VAAGKPRSTRKSTKSSGKTKTRSAKGQATSGAKPTRPIGPAAKGVKEAATKRPKAPAKPTKEPATQRAAINASKKSVFGRGTSPPSGVSRVNPQPPLPEHAPVYVQLGDETIEIPPEGCPIPKTKLSRKELREFKELLEVKRRELVGDVRNLTDQALRGRQAGGGGSNMPMHMADIGSDNWEQEFTLGLIENERGLLREIDEALDRIESRTYGICIATHRPIQTVRLRAKPWAKYCVEYARLRELGRVP